MLDEAIQKEIIQKGRDFLKKARWSGIPTRKRSSPIRTGICRSRRL